MYNLESYHTLTEYNRQGVYIIDDGLDVPEYTPIKLFFNEDLVPRETINNLIVYPRLRTHPRNVNTTSENFFAKTINENGDVEEKITSTFCNLRAHSVLIGFDGEALPVYKKVFFAKYTAFEMFLGSENGDFVIVGNPIVGRYRFDYKYNDSPSWNITAEAIVFASGLKIQWGNFTNHSGNNDHYTAQEERFFPVGFDKKPSMSFASNTGTNDNITRIDIPYAANECQWYVKSTYGNNKGTWMAIGY